MRNALSQIFLRGSVLGAPFCERPCHLFQPEGKPRHLSF